jgi:hypothetical protein
MEGKIIIGIFTAFILIITGTFMNSENLSKSQKVILFCLLIFPPAQWILGIFFFKINKKSTNENNSNKEKTLNFTNENDKIKLKENIITDKEKFNEKRILLNKSLEMNLITKIEFESKIKKIEFESKVNEKEKTTLLEFDKKKSILLELFNNKIITKEELKLKIKELENLLKEKKGTDLFNNNEKLEYTLLSKSEKRTSAFTSAIIVQKIRFENGETGFIYTKNKQYYFQDTLNQWNVIKHYYEDFDLCLNALYYFLETGKKLNTGYINSF